MACFGNKKVLTPEQKVEHDQSKKIDQQLQREAREQKKEVKILLLGPGESGKSTFFKQMKIIQQNGGYTQEELSPYKSVVWGNCITQIKVILQAMEKLGIALEREDNVARAQVLADCAPSGEAWTNSIAADVKALWADKGVQLCYQHRDKSYQLNDSAAYFFSNIDRFMEPNYLPTNQDVLRSRVRTTGIDEAYFVFDNLPFRMMDVGGQRTERRKWIHCFESVTVVIFCTALSEFDQTLREDGSQNRMKESLLLFDEISNSKWFRTTPFILFLNKMDLFKEKLERGKEITICFPNYTGGNNFEAASKYIQGRFLELKQAPHEIYPHLTCAIDTENIIVVWKVVKETILNTMLGETGLDI